MTMTVRAVYEGGVLRPEKPLELAEGAAVDLTIAAAPQRPPMTEDELIEKIKACRTYSEWMELMDSAPVFDDGIPEDYDIVKALNDNRIWSGDRPFLPPEGDRS